MSKIIVDHQLGTLAESFLGMPLGDESMARMIPAIAPLQFFPEGLFHIAKHVKTKEAENRTLYY